MIKNFTRILLLIGLMSSFTLQATDYYWKGGSGNYNDPNMWWLYSFNSGTTAIQAPISSDAVYFTAAAFTSPGAVITINANANCDDMVWDNAISVVNAPVVTSNTSVRLDIYGSLYFAANLNWQYRGAIRFRSTSNLEYIDTKGHELRTANLYITGADSTEFRLLSELNMANINISGYSGIQLNRGYFNANGFDLKINSIHLGRNSSVNPLGTVPNNSIGLNLENSTVIVYRLIYGAASRNKFHTFNTNFSHIKFIYGGVSRILAGFDIDSMTVTNNHRFDGCSPSVNHFYSYDKIEFYRGSRPIFENWYIRGTNPTIDFNGYGVNWVTVENVYMPNDCDKYTVFKQVNITTQVNKLIKKSPNANLNLDKAILQGIDCDTTNGKTYTASNSVDAGGNSPNWQFSVSGNQEMYFRATTNNLWSNPNNWEIWDGVNFLPNTNACLPTPIDHVYFDHLSFTGIDSIVTIDSVAYCHDMYWFDNVRANASLYFRQSLHAFGSVRLSNSMSTVRSLNRNLYIWYFYGKDPDTIETNGVFVNNFIDVRPHAYYELIGNLSGYYLGAKKKSRVHAENLEIRVSRMTIDSGYFNNVYAWLNAFSGGLNTVYAGTTTYEFDPGNGISGDYFYAGYSSTYLGSSVRLPNTICNKKHTSSPSVPSVIVEGDLWFKEGFFFNGPGSTRRVYITGAMSLYSGDLRVSPGYTYEFASGYRMSVADTLHSIGDCVNMVNWVSPSAPTQVSFGYADVNYNFIRGWNNTGGLVTANNSINAGTNTNVDFPSNIGTTYYWRANANNPTNFEGTWNTPGHWTTSPTDLVGVGGCLPTLADTVVFDSLSHSMTSNGCTIANLAYCNTIISKTNILLNGGSDLYISNSIILEDTLTNWSHTGKVLLIGNGTNGIIDTRGVYLNWSRLSIDNNAGVWNLLSPIESRGGYVQYNGTMFTNGHDLTIGGVHHYNGLFDFQNSTISILQRTLPNVSSPWVPWYHSGTGTLQANGSTILTNQSQFYGGGADYHHVVMGTALCSSCNYILLNGGSFQRLDILGNAQFRTNNTIDTLVLHGGNFYYLYANTVQTLSAPYGVIEVEDVGPGQFVNVESNIAGQKAYFHKEYGKAFCVDWIKVKDNEATKGSTPPAAWAADHSMLQFETGENSDNIGGTVTGIWNFEMPPILTVTTAHPPVIDLCAGDTTVFVPITMTGTYPYSIIYSWVDIWGNTGLDTIVVVDGDSNVLTPFVYNLELHPLTTTTYNLDIAALRCGGRNFGAPISIVTAQLPVDSLVEENTTGSCLLTNNTVWAHFMDDMNQRPMLSILDKTDLADNNALGLVNVQTNFDPSIQYWNGLPYLPRHWKIEPATNGPGRVRLYFTQADLDRLQTATIDQNIDPASELILYKFDDSITVGAGTIVPFSVVPLTGIAADPFATTNAIFAIEFEVTSFSGFLLQPTTLAALPLKLLSFDAVKKTNSKVALTWSVEDPEDARYYKLERSVDGIYFDHLATVNGSTTKYYNYEDKEPYLGTSYYRLKLVNQQGDEIVSHIRSVTINQKRAFEIFPNPIQNNEIQLRITNYNLNHLRLRLYNNLGQLIFENSYNLKNDNVNVLQLKLPSLGQGAYLLNVLDVDNNLLESQWLMNKE